MSKQTINIGASPNDGTGTPLRTSFDYTNQNFTELYTAVGPSGNNIVVPGTATITGDLTVDTSTLKVDSTNNRVGIGTASPTAALDVYLAEVSSAAGTTAIITNTTGGGNRIAALRLGNLSNQWNIRAIGSGDTFRIGSGGTGSETDYLTLDASGNLLVGVASTNANGGVLQLKSGITFPATQVAASDANTLDDYEEGTFTPTIVGATTAGVGVYTTQAGYYTKVGNLVTASVFLGWTAHTGTGNMYFAGLPFASSSSASYHGAASISYVNNIALTASNVLTLFISGGASSLEASQYPVGGGGATNVPVDVSGNIIYTVTYRV